MNCSAMLFDWLPKEHCCPFLATTAFVQSLWRGLCWMLGFRSGTVDMGSLVVIVATRFPFATFAEA